MTELAAEYTWRRARIGRNAPDSVLFGQLRQLAEADNLWVRDRPDLKTRQWCCVNAVTAKRGSFVLVPTKFVELQDEIKVDQAMPRPIIRDCWPRK